MLSKKIAKIVIIFLSISFNMCFGCSKEPSQQDSSFEYPQHMFWLRSKKSNFQLHTLIWGPDLYFSVKFKLLFFITSFSLELNTTQYLGVLSRNYIGGASYSLLTSGLQIRVGKSVNENYFSCCFLTKSELSLTDNLQF